MNICIVLYIFFITQTFLREVVIGCRSDGECPSQTACINGDCIDPCGLDPCGENTECRVVDTVPVRTIACECLPGYQGDAAEKCVESEISVLCNRPGNVSCFDCPELVY